MEVELRRALAAIETGPADPRLTRAGDAVQSALALVADYYEDLPPPPPPPRGWAALVALVFLAALLMVAALAWAQAPVVATRAAGDLPPPVGEGLAAWLWWLVLVPLPLALRAGWTVLARWLRRRGETRLAELLETLAPLAADAVAEQAPRALAWKAEQGGKLTPDQARELASDAAGYVLARVSERVRRQIERLDEPTVRVAEVVETALEQHREARRGEG